MSLRVLGHDADFVPTYQKLKADPKQNKAMLDAIDNIKQQLEKSNDPLGIRHKRKCIPSTYKTRYSLQALYHFEMPDDYRLMYTVRTASGMGKEALFLDLLTHHQYNKLFGYFKTKSHK